MSKWRNSAFAAAAIAATLGAAASFSVAQSGGEAIVKYRQALMGAQGAHMGAIAAIVKGDVTYADQLAAHVQALNDLANMIPAAFAEAGSDAETRALPAIWEDHEGFLAKAEALQTATAEFATAAEGGDMAAIGAAMGPVGEACQGCHETYRGE